MRLLPWLLMAVGILPLLAQAQDQAAPQPAAAQTAPAAEPQAEEQPQAAPKPQRPARHRPAAPAASPGTAVANSAGEEAPGTTLIGDRETPLGLYLTPWKNEYAERGMDRPPQNFQEPLAPVDPKVFNRQLDYYDVITVYRQQELGGQK
jgi:hypothetical protein